MESKYKVGDKLYFTIESQYRDGNDIISTIAEDEYGRVNVCDRFCDHCFPIEKSYEDGVIEGQNMAWELAKKIVVAECNGGFSNAEINDIFGTPFPVEKLSAQEALKKLKVYEEMDFEVGDEIIMGSSTGIITNFERDGVHVLWIPNGTTQMFFKNGFSAKKTGRNVRKILKGLLTPVNE